MRAVLGFAFFLAIGIAFFFMVFPVVAIFFHVPPGRLLHEFRSPIVTDALIVSGKTIVESMILILLFGTPTAWFLASRRFPGRTFLVTLAELPIVLPPAVAGIGLLVAFGRLTFLGRHLAQIGINLSFNQTAVDFAIMLVAGPFYVRQAIASFEAVDHNLIAASRTLGAGPLRTFFKVTIPLARGGLAAGFAICMARGLGEFGATIMFAGSFQGRTETLPLAIYTQFEGNFTVAVAISALLIVISLAILLALKLSVLWQPSRQTSNSPFARFGSS
ncbi:MAG TPA: ABC transporter permease [Gaiellaceae bacterium]|jgi:molybdate transport system permease protein|nr:ABC transporter permease [Gaiellaceae bacterium]